MEQNRKSIEQAQVYIEIIKVYFFSAERIDY